ncbi:unnamed protein product [Psylliodes chrysocephalus]|uniref:Thaumatin-like protein n=1 Tax=Psylliodes chrysocephalus TaxID=3402493 RepID=A0A9P0CM51_9CUCU|nr:unnamed protein product [Psylliodes chrysocephala]
MFKLLVLSVFLKAAMAVEFEIFNKETGPIWIGIQGNSGKAHLEGGGFVLAPGQRRSVQSPPDWGGRFWARTWCNAGNNHCETGDCGNKLQCQGAGGRPPASLAEITLKGKGPLDFYDISFVDGFNLPISFEPVGGQGDGSQYSCKKASCNKYLNGECPGELQLKYQNQVIGCKSACEAFNTDQYCCRGAYDKPETCKSSEWKVNYPKFFKDRCPDGYSYAQAIEFQFVNKEIGAVWVGIQGNSGKEALANGGFILEAGASTSIQAPEDWAGRFWGRTWCDPNTNYCLTGDCGSRIECQGNGGAPPASLAEITLKGAGGLDFYEISLVDGFNLAISFEPVDGRGDSSQYSCKKAACEQHLNDECPGELQLGSPNGVVGCKSACLAFNTDQYCCRNEFGTPDTFKSLTWPVDYPKFFKDRCPGAYSYAYDDRKSTFTCEAEKYIITFGF